MSTRSEKLRLVCSRLNSDRAKMDDAFRLKHGRIIQFNPCEKSLVFLAALCTHGDRPPALSGPGLVDIDNTTVLSFVELRACLIPCYCHSGLSANDLMEMEYIAKPAITKVTL